MNRLWSPTGLVLTGLAVLCLAVPAVAQAPQDQVPFKATVVSPFVDLFRIPVSPPIGDAHLTAKGEATLLGPVTLRSRATIHFGVDGRPVSLSNWVGALTADSGDALFISANGLVRATATGFTNELGYTVTGGRGRFAGATGSGVSRAVGDLSKNETTVVFEGTISAPKTQ